MTGDHDDLGVDRSSLGTRQNLEATDVVHHQVGDDDVERLLLDLPGSLRTTANHHDLIVEPAQHLAHGAGMDDVVVDDQHAHKSLEPSGGRWLRGGDGLSGLIHGPLDGT